MRLAPVIALAAVLAMLAAGCGSTRTVVHTVTVAAKPAPAGTADQQLYGQIRSLKQTDGHYELRFDPAWFLSGVSANVAQAEDSGMHCAPTACPPVANDNYIVDEGHRALTFIVPTGVHGTVLVKNGTAGSPFPATAIGAGQLAQVVAGKSALKLFEPLSSGVWIVTRNGIVRGFAQQYRP
jgi:hypothetical protein